MPQPSTLPASEQFGTNSYPANDAACATAQASPKRESGMPPIYSLSRYSTELRRTETMIFVGESGLLHYIASLGPAEVEERASGVPHPTEEGVFCLPLLSGRAALIDAEDYSLVRAHSWAATADGRVQTCHSFGGVVTSIRLHRLVMLMGPDDDRVVDHINHDAYDNRKANLRICTQQQNTFNQRLSSANTSGFKGVSRSQGRWKGFVGFNGKDYVRYFDTAEEADAWARKTRTELHGEFACHG